MLNINTKLISETTTSILLLSRQIIIHNAIIKDIKQLVKNEYCTKSDKVSYGFQNICINLGIPQIVPANING